MGRRWGDCRAEGQQKNTRHEVRDAGRAGWLIGRLGDRESEVVRRGDFSSSDFDVLIAATAKTHGLTVATLNVRHFEGVHGLAVEDWS